MGKSHSLGIAIPTYKRENYLRILLNSIPTDIDVVVSDNGGFTSPEFKEEFNHRTFVSSDQVVNMFQNWNTAIDHLQTEWICLASDDDVFFSNAFTSFAKYLNQFPDSDCIIFGHKNIDENGTKLGQWSPSSLSQLHPPDGYNLFKYGVDARPISVFFKKELYNKIGKLDEEYKITSADSDFIQLALLNGITLFVPEIVSGYRIWNKSLTSTLNASSEWMEEIDKWQRKIAIVLKHMNFTNNEIKINTNEVIARNLLSGLYSLKRQKKSLKESLQYISQFKYPYYATLRTQIQLLKCLLRIGLKI